MNIGVHMTLKEYEDLKKDQFQKGNTEGHQGAFKFLKDVTQDPRLEYCFGFGFPEDLKQFVIELITKLREDKNAKTS